MPTFSLPPVTVHSRGAAELVANVEIVLVDSQESAFLPCMDVKPPIDAELWEAIPAEAQVALLAVFADLAARIAQLEQTAGEQQAELERLRKNSSNSSFPPSSDKPDFKRARPKKRGQRNKGGQKGHDKHKRRLVPIEHVDTVEPCKPTTCDGCGEPLAGDDPDFERRQVWEIPPLTPDVTE